MTHTIQISIYNWVIDEELIYETQVSSPEEMVALIYSYGKKVRFKKPTDKNWYYGRTLVKRLFKKELKNVKPLVKIADSKDLRSKEQIKRDQELGYNKYSQIKLFPSDTGNLDYMPEF